MYLVVGPLLTAAAALTVRAVLLALVFRRVTSASRQRDWRSLTLHAVSLLTLVAFGVLGHRYLSILETELAADDAEGMGMTTFAKVAAQVSDLSKRNDPAALAASLARLVRVGEASLAAVWDLQDLRL